MLQKAFGEIKDLTFLRNFEKTARLLPCGFSMNGNEEEEKKEKRNKKDERWR